MHIPSVGFLFKNAKPQPNRENTSDKLKSRVFVQQALANCSQIWAFAYFQKWSCTGARPRSLIYISSRAASVLDSKAEEPPQRSRGLQSWRYLLPGPWPKKLADPCLQKWLARALSKVSRSWKTRGGWGIVLHWRRGWTPNKVSGGILDCIPE